MTRKKVNLVYITDDATRKASYKKRKKGLMKKVSELSTLCGVDACAIMYSPYEPQPEVWPSPMGVQQVLAKFRQIPEMEQSKKKVNQESFLIQRITKANEQLKKQCRINREKEMTHLMFQNLMGNASIEGLNMMDLNDLGWLIDQKLKEIEKRIDTLSQTSHDPQGSSSSVAATPSMMSEAMPRTSLGDSVQTEANNMYSMEGQHWTMELMNNNPQSYVGFGDDEMVFPFGDNINVNNNAFFA
ncbi:Agamous-like MADS-box protein AGL80 [Hibiscus syriacus]|uniref:Agamous-like MADS-box protein AGL80 n=1 Tax=Hibiscus syriacus TaxID=106335 RepID=A0A6A3B3D2_HIBSY|nr:agamous-like MADS-box protein AGL80 [Hibiscus syriacus]KAE8711490.1 Agamous-like MADS-box protein AGL80 [Hibiscus syriacus]